MKFSIGDLVVEKKVIHSNSSYVVQKVVGVIDDSFLTEHYGYSYDGLAHPETYKSEPGSRNWRSSFQRYQEKELFSFKEAEEQHQRLKEAENKLNQEFEFVREQVQANLNQAAALIQEAGTLAKAHNQDFFGLRDECMPLYKALEAGGWSHSHMKC